MQGDGGGAGGIGGEGADEDPLVALLGEMRDAMERQDEKLEDLSEAVDQLAHHMDTLADMMLRTYRVTNDICNFNVYDRLNSAAAIQLLKKVSPQVDDAAIEEAVSHRLAKLQQRGWFAHLADLEALLAERKEFLRDVRKTRVQVNELVRERDDRLYREAEVEEAKEKETRAKQAAKEDEQSRQAGQWEDRDRSR